MCGVVVVETSGRVTFLKKNTKTKGRFFIAKLLQRPTRGPWSSCSSTTHPPSPPTSLFPTRRRRSMAAEIEHHPRLLIVDDDLSPSKAVEQVGGRRLKEL